MSERVSETRRVRGDWLILSITPHGLEYLHLVESNDTLLTTEIPSKGTCWLSFNGWNISIAKRKSGSDQVLGENMCCSCGYQRETSVDQGLNLVVLRDSWNIIETSAHLAPQSSLSYKDKEDHRNLCCVAWARSEGENLFWTTWESVKPNHPNFLLHDTLYVEVALSKHWSHRLTNRTIYHFPLSNSEFDTGRSNMKSYDVLFLECSETCMKTEVYRSWQKFKIDKISSEWLRQKGQCGVQLIGSRLAPVGAMHQRLLFISSNGTSEISHRFSRARGNWQRKIRVP